VDDIDILTLDPKSVDNLIKKLTVATGVKFEYYKKNFLEKRIKFRINSLKLYSCESYLDYITTHPEEINLFQDKFTINYTYFFRNYEIFKKLEDFIKDFKIGLKEPIHIWSCPCATGEEPYSIAMFLDNLKKKNPNFPDYEIFASDIDKSAIDIAKKGIYGEDILNDIPKIYETTYFAKKSQNNGPKYVICKEIKDQVEFIEEDLTKGQKKHQKYDIIFCRNFLIYINKKSRKKVMQIFENHSKKVCLLVLGKTETLIEPDSIFKSFDSQNHFYIKDKSNLIDRFKAEDEQKIKQPLKQIKKRQKQVKPLKKPQKKYFKEPLEKKIKPLKKQIKSPVKQIKPLKKQIKPPEKQGEIRFKYVEDHFKKIELRFRQVELLEKQIELLEKQVNQRLKQVEILKNQVIQREKELEEPEKELELLENQLELLENQLEQRKKRLKQREKKVEKRVKQLAQLEKEVEQRVKYLEQLEKEVEQRVEQRVEYLEQLEKQVEKRRKQVKKRAKQQIEKQVKKGVKQVEQKAELRKRPKEGDFNRVVIPNIRGEIVIPEGHYALINSKKDDVTLTKFSIYELGSGIALILKDDINKIYAMSHCLLPSVNSSADSDQLEQLYKSIKTSISNLLNMLLSNGANKENIKAIILGGARLFNENKSSIQKSIKMFKIELNYLQIPIDKEDIGGLSERSIIYDTKENSIFVKKAWESYFRILN
jgi:chemotaxis methyl-accepting protein methylase/chemotaxis receptor (MCP) glutamine deamidase CheD